MRVLHLTRDFPPRHCGGISTAVGGLVAALERSGIACATASFDDYRPGKHDTALDPAAPAPDGSLLRIDDGDDLRALVPFARSFRPELIVLHVDLLWEVASELRRRLEVPIATVVHVCHRRMLQVVGADRASASLSAQERALATSDRIVAPSRAVADALVEDDPGVEARMHVAGFTVDLKPAASLEARRLIVVGRFGAVKGTDRLIELLPHLLADPELTIDVVGGLPRSPRRERRWRERLIAAAGSDRLRLHGWLDPPERDARLVEARAFLSVSRIESFGLAALEALAHGVGVCGYREPALVESAPGQLWLDEDDPARVAEAVLARVADRPGCLDAGAQGRAAIRPWTAIARDWRRALGAETC